MGKNEDSSKKIEELEKTSSEQANTIARLENEIKKLGDVNASPRIIQKGNQRHVKFQKNNIRTPATIPKEEPVKKSKKE